MKLKYITLISFIVFVGAILAFAFLPPQKIEIPTNNEVVLDNNSNTNTDAKTNTNNSSVINNVKSITLTTLEVAKHNTRNDCYLIIKNQVYSVASFIDKHPGGVDKLLG